MSSLAALGTSRAGQGRRIFRHQRRSQPGGRHGQQPSQPVQTAWKSNARGSAAQHPQRAICGAAGMRAPAARGLIWAFCMSAHGALIMMAAPEVTRPLAERRSLRSSVRAGDSCSSRPVDTSTTSTRRSDGVAGRVESSRVPTSRLLRRRPDGQFGARWAVD